MKERCFFGSVAQMAVLLIVWCAGVYVLSELFVRAVDIELNAREQSKNESTENGNLSKGSPAYYRQSWRLAALQTVRPGPLAHTGETVAARQKK